MNISEEYKKHKSEIEARLQEFSKLPSKEHIKELFFCILTPQSNAEKCWQAVQELEKCDLEKSQVQKCLKTRTRFYKNKTKYILEAKNRWNAVKEKINLEKDSIKLRNWLADNIKGLGMKESSHFLRNIGKSNNELAILDRHILRKMQEINLIKDIKIKKSSERTSGCSEKRNFSDIKNKKDYLEKEKLLKEFSISVNIPPDHLDLLFWKLESGRIFK